MTSKMEERYEGMFLDALDLPEGVEVPVTIEAIADPFSEKDSAGKPIKLAVMSFKGKQKRLIINKTNFKNLKAMFGREPKDWIGKSIKIQRRYLDADRGFGVQNTLAIRIIPPVGTPILKSAANFMGSPTPYGQTAKQAKPRQEPSKQTAPKTGPPPAATPNQDQDELAQWFDTIRFIDSVEQCSQFRTQLLPECPEPLRGRVEQELNNRETQLRKES